MASFERICPQCGASNAYNVSNCIKCRAPLKGQSTTPAPMPLPFTRRGMAVLAWRATKFLARTGFGIAKGSAMRSIERIQNRNHQDVTNETIEGEFSVSEWRGWGAKPETGNSKTAEPLHWGPKK